MTLIEIMLTSIIICFMSSTDMLTENWS